MYKVLLNLLNLTATGSVATIQVPVPESHKAELEATPSARTQLKGVQQVLPLTLLSRLKILLQIQQGVCLYISKGHNHAFTCFKVKIIYTVKQSDINKFTKISSIFQKQILVLVYIVKNSKFSLYLQKK